MLARVIHSFYSQRLLGTGGDVSDDLNTQFKGPYRIHEDEEHTCSTAEDKGKEVRAVDGRWEKKGVATTIHGHHARDVPDCISTSSTRLITEPADQYSENEDRRKTRDVIVQILHHIRPEEYER